MEGLDFLSTHTIKVIELPVLCVQITIHAIDPDRLPAYIGARYALIEPKTHRQPTQKSGELVNKK